MNNRKRMIAKVYHRNPALLEDKAPSVLAKLIMETSVAGEITKSLVKAIEGLADMACATTKALNEIGMRCT